MASARHIEAFLTQLVPDEYYFQALQYFMVNDKLKTLYFIFYDPRIPAKNFFYLTLKRSDLKDEIKMYLDYQKQTIEEVNEIVNKLTF